MFSTYFAAAAAFFSLVAVIYSTFAVQYSRKCKYYCDSVLNWVENENEASKVLKQLTDHEVVLTDHADSLSALHTTLKKLRSRIGMRELHAKRAGQADEVPDSRTDPEGWKAHMRQQLHLDKNFGGK